MERGVAESEDNSGPEFEATTSVTVTVCPRAPRPGVAGRGGGRCRQRASSTHKRPHSSLATPPFPRTSMTDAATPPCATYCAMSARQSMLNLYMSKEAKDVPFDAMTCGNRGMVLPLDG